MIDLTWRADKPGTKTPRRYRKLHIAVDTECFTIARYILTGQVTALAFSTEPFRWSR
jgi:hypothetical protein